MRRSPNKTKPLFWTIKPPMKAAVPSSRPMTARVTDIDHLSLRVGVDPLATIHRSWSNRTRLSEDLVHVADQRFQLRYDELLASRREISHPP